MYPPPPPSDLLQHIPLSARTIVDIGCRNGQLTAAYRLLNPNAHVLDGQSDTSTVRNDHYDPMALDDKDVTFELADGVDCIIYNSILQHLRDPWTLIRRHIKSLSPGGIVLICIPNIDYWRRTKQRLHGVWVDPSVAGITCQPADWLNRNGMEQKLNAAGLVLCDITPYEPDRASADQFAATLAPGLLSLGIDPNVYADRAAASHLILRAGREQAEPMIVAGNMLSPVGGVSHVRVLQPLQALTTERGITARVTDRVEPRQHTDQTPRIFVLHRPVLMGKSGLDTVRMLTNAGYLVVTEFDDHPDHFEMMRLGGAQTFTGVHAVQTSTIAMAEVLRQYNPEIAVFPNALVSLPEVVNFADPGSVTMFFGALNREQDWLALMPAINAVAGRAGDRLKFQVVHDQGFFDALDTPHKSFTPTCDYETYMQILARSEISFMPLSDTPFNRAKSDLKFIEAGSYRVAALASTVVYGNSIEDGRTGLLFRDPVEFENRLARLVAMPELAMALGDASRRHVAANRMLAYQVAPRIAWYRSLWARRAALDEALQGRALRDKA